MKKHGTLILGALLGLLTSDGAAAIRGRSRFGVRGSRPVGTTRDVVARRKVATPSFGVASGGTRRPVPRGGACSDSTPELFAKVALGAAVEAGLMYGLARYAVKVNAMDYSKVVARSIQAGVLLLIIFGSASFGAIVDNGLSAASKQVLDPNTIPGDEDWYANLKKPSWNPPGWLFPIMWLVVSKPTQFMAVWKLITQSYEKDLSIPLAVYCSHLALGDAWNKVFFGLECTGRGLAVILTFWSVLLLSAYLFYGVDKYAGLLLLPTSAWVTVATALNWSFTISTNVKLRHEKPFPSAM
ncbi:hypothetical protein ACHAWF_018037 [Thalassiosira exigua]